MCLIAPSFGSLSSHLGSSFCLEIRSSELIIQFSLLFPSILVPVSQNFSVEYITSAYVLNFRALLLMFQVLYSLLFMLPGNQDFSCLRMWPPLLWHCFCSFQVFYALF